MSSKLSLPPHWKMVRLGEVTTLTKKPRDLRYSEYNEIPFVPMELIPIAKLSSEAFIFKTNDELSSGTYFESGDILLPKITPSFENGKQCIIKGLPTPFGIATTEVIPIREIVGVSDKFYLFFYLLLPNVRTLLAGKMQGTTGRQRLNKETLVNLEIPLPSPPEQLAIAKVLQTIQEAKFTRQREIALEGERKAALMDHLFSHGTKGEPRKQTEIGEIPESWEVVQTGEIGKIVTGNTPKTSVPEYYGGPYMFISPGDISEPQYVTKTNKYVSAEGLKVLRPLPRDSVLVVCIGSTIGKTAMTSAEQSATNQQINAIIPKAKAFPHYVYYAVTYRSRSLPALAGRAAVPIVKKSSFAKFLIPFPPISEQHTIANIFRAIDKKTAALQREVELMEELFHAMLEELMTGKRSATPLIEDGEIQ